ncbi:MAG: NADPH:quinone reductase [Thermodesulfobacteriota bacterium]
MEAIRVHEFGGPEVMKLEDVPQLNPGAGQVLVGIRAAGVNPVDVYIRQGTYGSLPDLPYTPGMDAAGIIEAVGEGVTDMAVGDRVYTAGTLTGAYAGQALCKAAQVHRLPKQVSFQQGASVGVPYAIAYKALFMRGRAQPGETVLVHGATGGAGIAAVQLARAAGLKVIGTGGSVQGRESVLQQGAHHVADHRNPDHVEEIIHLTKGLGVDLVLEMLANVNLGQDLKMLNRSGRVVVIGSRGSVEIDPRDLMIRDAAVFGVLLFNTPERDLAAIHSALVAGLENRTLRPVVGREIPLAEAPRSHVEVMTSQAVGKTVLIP